MSRVNKEEKTESGRPYIRPISRPLLELCLYGKWISHLSKSKHSYGTPNVQQFVDPSALTMARQGRELQLDGTSIGFADP